MAVLTPDEKGHEQGHGIHIEVATDIGGYLDSVCIPADHELVVLCRTAGIGPMEQLSKTR